MNDKERLEIIKSSVAPTRENTKYVLVSSDHAKWLIEQAERFNAYVNDTALIHERNKRYREALEKIANHETYGLDVVSHDFRMSDVGKLARQALEGEVG